MNNVQLMVCDIMIMLVIEKPTKKNEPTQDGHLQLLLFESERAWSYAQDLLTLSLNQPPDASPSASSLRHHATGRFRRAIHWATQLLSTCQSLYTSSRLSALSLLEATIYTLILNGRFLRFRDDFDSALVQLSVARSLLDELADPLNAPTSRDQALASVFADEIGAEIRYCAHELGMERAWDVDSIVKDVGKKERAKLVDGVEEILKKYKEQVTESKGGHHQKEQRILEPLMWEGEPIPVRNPELVDVLLKVQQAEKKLDGAYDAILSALSDAEDVARRLAESQGSGGSGIPASNVGGAGPGASGGGTTRDVQFVHTYIVYQLLSRRIQRDLLLGSALISQAQVESESKSASTKSKTPSTGPGAATSQSKPTSGLKDANSKDVHPRILTATLKLLDTILQSLNQMRTLSIVDDNPDLAEAVDARVSWTRGRRCLNLAHCYASPPIRKYAEALTLIQHANLHLRETTSHLSLASQASSSGQGDGDDNADLTDLISSPPPNSGTIPFYALSQLEVRLLERELGRVGLRVKRDWFAWNGGVGQVTAADGSEESSKKQRTNKKKPPLFFNIALNYVELDMERLEERGGGKATMGAGTTTNTTKSSANTNTNTKTNTKPVEQTTTTMNTNPMKKSAALDHEDDMQSRSGTPEPSSASALGSGSGNQGAAATLRTGGAGGGLSSLLGGWWGRS
ncbi:hypothetical protein D9758_000005 [Tetrapyrgos nigripes]|uniref:Signal recognition particle subunit SRP68 n=1 Tax=Tetrapyrgos nigripes TaxID=182062 RepID=A0A8H5H1Y1_9AGAR|nr:hypothetical protein D9758_000005 [Tetrapyrgos nigripes]